jgi:hypothetical protein
MRAIHRLRYSFVDTPTSVGAQSRARRWDRLAATFPDLAQMSVIDLGGRFETWRGAPVRPAHLHVVNLEAADGEIPEWAEFTHADVCEPPDAIARRRYDLVFSNSVIEHVGGPMNRARFAETAREAADRHWVQTPYRYFPVEPHWLFPGSSSCLCLPRWSSRAAGRCRTPRPPTTSGPSATHWRSTCWAAPRCSCCSPTRRSSPSEWQR